MSQFGGGGGNSNGGGPPRGPGQGGPYSYGSPPQGGPPQQQPAAYPQQLYAQYPQQQPYQAQQPPQPQPPQQQSPDAPEAEEPKAPVVEKKSRTVTLAAAAVLLVIVLVLTIWFTYGVQFRPRAETLRLADQALSSPTPETAFPDATDDESKAAAKVIHEEGLKLPTFSSDTGNYGTDSSRGAICYRGQAGPKTVHLIVTHAGLSGSQTKVERMSVTRACKCRIPPPKEDEKRRGVQCDFWK